MFPKIESYCRELNAQFGAISAERKNLLLQISQYIVTKRKQGKPVQLVYICTHNSRRSHFAQIWAKVASAFYGVAEIHAFSGGTEVTAFNANAIHALKRVGFVIAPEAGIGNVHYSVRFGTEHPSIEAFSKLFDDGSNPQSGFAAVMTCSDGQEECPFVPGAALRVAVTYEDPKHSDNTPQQEQVYDARCKQIALESLFVFANAAAALSDPSPNTI